MIKKLKIVPFIIYVFSFAICIYQLIIEHSQTKNIILIVLFVINICGFMLWTWSLGGTGRKIVNGISYTILLLIWIFIICCVPIPIIAKIAELAKKWYGINSDTWIAYLGAVMGSGLTVAGAFIVMKIQNKKR